MSLSFNPTINTSLTSFFSFWQGLQVYPNPNRRSFNFSTKLKSTGIYRFYTTNILGHQIADLFTGFLPLVQEFINIKLETPLKRGTYIIVAQNNHSKIASKIIIK